MTGYNFFFSLNSLSVELNTLNIAWFYLHSHFRGGLRKRMHFKTECVMAVQGHLRSLILVSIESAYATSY